MAKRTNKDSHSSGTNKTKGRNKVTRSDSTGDENDIEKKTLGNDYWNRVAEDVASGYKTNHDKSPVLNEDEQPGDDEKAGSH